MEISKRVIYRRLFKKRVEIVRQSDVILSGLKVDWEGILCKLSINKF